MVILMIILSVKNVIINAQPVVVLLIVVLLVQILTETLPTLVIVNQDFTIIIPKIAYNVHILVQLAVTHKLVYHVLIIITEKVIVLVQMVITNFPSNVLNATINAKTAQSNQLNVVLVLT